MSRLDSERIASRGDSILSTLWQNLRYAGRRLIQAPGFTLMAVGSLALGIGANTAIFSLVNAILLRELPFRAPEELVNIYTAYPDYHYNPFSYPDFEDVRDQTEEVFSGVTASQLLLIQIDRDGGVENLAGEAVTGNTFTLLGMEAEVGRTLLPEDDVTEGAHPVVMLGYAYWQRVYGADRDAVGQEIRLGGRPYTIVGVAPEGYTGSWSSSSSPSCPP